jgi:hypothetical protein
VDVRVVPEGAGRVILGDLELEGEAAAGLDVDEDVVAVATRRDVKAVGVEVGRVEDAGGRRAGHHVGVHVDRRGRLLAAGAGVRHAGADLARRAVELVFEPDAQRVARPRHQGGAYQGFVVGAKIGRVLADLGGGVVQRQAEYELPFIRFQLLDVLELGRLYGSRFRASLGQGRARREQRERKRRRRHPTTDSSHGSPP